jgi:hypothetical protein
MDMVWLIGASTLALVSIAGLFGSVGTAAILLVSVLWLMVALRPVEAGVLVADWSRRRFE